MCVISMAHTMMTATWPVQWLWGGIAMAVYEDRHCLKCRRVVRMIRCEICRGRGTMPTTQCRQNCNVHGKNY
jgi:hypothetical protein